MLAFVVFHVEYTRTLALQENFAIDVNATHSALLLFVLFECIPIAL